MNKTLKHILIIVFVIASVAIIGSCYMTDDILARALVVGMGIDHDGENYKICCEVVNGTSANSQVSAGGDQNRLYKGEGKTLAEALQNIQERWGRIPSLGECCAIIFGEDICKSNKIEDAVIFLVRYNTLKDGVLLLSCDGKAEELLDRQTASNKSISISLKQIVQTAGKYSTIPENHLSKFIYEQMNPSKTSYLPHVRLIKDEQKSSKSDEQSDLKNVILDLKQIALFQDFRIVEKIQDDIRDGFALIAIDKCYVDFNIKDDEQGSLQAQRSGAGLIDKKAKIEAEMPKSGGGLVKITLTARMGYTHADINARLKTFMQKTDTAPNEQSINEVRRQIEKKTADTVKFSKEKNIDFLGLQNILYAKFGQKWIEEAQKHENVLENIEVVITVKTSK